MIYLDAIPKVLRFAVIANLQRKTPYEKKRLLTLAPDLRKTPPRSPRETLGGFVIAARIQFYYVG
jgi:hypothetical protein